MPRMPHIECNLQGSVDAVLFDGTSPRNTEDPQIMQNSTILVNLGDDWGSPILGNLYTLH